MRNAALQLANSIEKQPLVAATTPTTTRKLHVHTKVIVAAFKASRSFQSNPHKTYRMECVVVRRAKMK